MMTTAFHHLVVVLLTSLSLSLSLRSLSIFVIRLKEGKFDFFLLVYLYTPMTSSAFPLLEFLPKISLFLLRLAPVVGEVSISGTVCVASSRFPSGSEGS